MSTFAQVVAAWALGLGIHFLSQAQWGFGPWSLLTVAVVVSVAGLLLPGTRHAARFNGRWVELALGVALAHQWLVMLISVPAKDLQAPNLHLFRAGVVLAGGLMAALWLGRGRWAFTALLAVHLGLGVWILRASPSPFIDVFTWHNEALDLLATGKNPYAATMPDLYGHPDIFPPGYLKDGRVLTGYPYPPLELALAWLGRTLGGDFRFMHLVAITGAGALIGSLRRDRRSFLAAALFLFTPRTWYVLERAWNDVYLGLLLAALAFLAVRGGRRLSWALGLMFAVKQHMVLIAGLVPLLFAGSWRRALPTLGIAVALAAAITAPVALLDLEAFWHSVVMLQLRQPFRPDALSFLSLWYWKLSDHVVPPSWIGWLALVPAYWLAWRHAPRTPSGTAASIALLYLLFFAFGKQAFTNYYHFIIAALCVAVAAARPGEEAEVR